MAGRVTVGCKLPHGLVLRLFTEEEGSEPVMGGGFRSIRVFREMPGARVTLKGYAAPHGQAPEARVEFGYALTPDVDADFWDVWVGANMETEVVKNKLVFAHARTSDVVAEANENRERRNGLEPMDPSMLPRGIETAVRPS